MNRLIQLRQSHEQGEIKKQEYIEAIHALHTQFFAYPEFLQATDVEALSIRPEGVFVRSRSQQVELFLDPEDQHLVPYTLMNFRNYEMLETEFLKSLMHAGSVVLDIGANCGWHSLVLSRHCPAARIYAFEPIPHTYDILLRNVRHNGCRNIETFQSAFSNQQGFLEFLYTPCASGSTSLVEAGQPVESDKLEKITCPSTTLDSFCAKHELAPDVIKCDVEGAELMVIEGGERVLATHKPVILIELLRKWSRKFGYHPNDVVKLLGGYGYRAYTLSESGLKPCSVIDEETVETNFVFLHSQAHGHIA